MKDSTGRVWSVLDQGTKSLTTPPRRKLLHPGQVCGGIHARIHPEQGSNLSRWQIHSFTTHEPNPKTKKQTSKQKKWTKQNKQTRSTPTPEQVAGRGRAGWKLSCCIIALVYTALHPIISDLSDRSGNEGLVTECPDEERIWVTGAAPKLDARNGTAHQSHLNRQPSVTGPVSTGHPVHHQFEPPYRRTWERDR